MFTCILKAALLIMISAGDNLPSTSVRIQCSFCSLSDHAKRVAVTSVNWYKNIEHVY